MNGPIDRHSNDRGADWRAALEERLLAQRIAVANGRFDESLAADLSARLMYLDAMGDDPIVLRIASLGGTIDAAMTVIDVIDALGVPVHATASGAVEGAAVGVLAVCARRAAMPHARFRLSEESVSYDGHAREIESWVASHHERLALFAACVARGTRAPVEEVLVDIASGRYLTAEEARSYGLIDEVTSPEGVIRDLRPLDGRSGLGFRPPTNS